MSAVTRRAFVQGAGAVLGGLVAGRNFGAAQAREEPLRVLTRAEAMLLGALGESLVPGAAAAGMAYFIDAQLDVSPEEAMLLLKYVDVPPPFADFYRAGASALEAACRAEHQLSFVAATSEQRRVLVGKMLTGNPAGWQGPPAPLFHFVLRSDALDVVFGTPEGFARLGVPSMLHIAPPTPWAAARRDRPARTASSSEPAEVVIVGAGQAGSLLAARLASAGKRVVILESGPERGLTDLVSSQIWARRLKWGGPATTSGPHPIGVHFNAGSGLGGSAVHHYGCWFRLHPEDFEMRSRTGVSWDWPLSYDDLRPHYDRVQEEVGISGDADAEVWRPAGAPYPMPPLPSFPQGQLLAKGFQARGLRTAPLPLAINSVPYRGRPACIYDGWCDAGCPTGALANPLVLHLRVAEKAGAEVRTGCAVSRVLTNAQGTRATGVEYFTPDGARYVQPAERVILAAFSIENARILLNSANAEHPDGLANRSAALGRFLAPHIAGNVWGMFAEETHNHLGVTGGQRVCQEGYRKDAARGFVGSYQWLVANALKPNDLLGIAGSRPELFGAELEEFLRRAVKHLATMTLVGESIPRAENRVRITAAKDRFGFARAELVHGFGPDALALFSHAMSEGEAVFRAAGSRETWHGPPVTMHIMGGTRMGDDPADSVTDSYGRSHEVPNLFIAGSSLFPSVGGVNPTFTLTALADRTAEHLIAHWSDSAG